MSSDPVILDTIENKLEVEGGSVYTLNTVKILRMLENHFFSSSGNHNYKELKQSRQEN